MEEAIALVLYSHNVQFVPFLIIIIQENITTQTCQSEGTTQHCTKPSNEMKKFASFFFDSYSNWRKIIQEVDPWIKINKDR